MSLESKYPERITEKAAIEEFEFYIGKNLPLAKVDILKATPEELTTVIPTIVVPGFTEGITQDGKFAEYLAEATGGEVLVIGQYERKDKKFISPSTALDNQATALVKLIQNMHREDGPVNIFANSLGAAVFAKAAEITHELHWSCFKESTGSKIVFMAPVGTKDDDSMLKIGKRFAIDGGPMRAHLKEQDGWDKDSLDAGQILIKADPKKAMAEALLAAKSKIPYENLKGIRINVLTSPKDGVFGQEALGESIMKLIESGSLNAWATPYAANDDYADAVRADYDRLMDESPDGTEKSHQAFNKSSGAEHNTHMVNDKQAKRTAEAVAAFLQA